MLTTLKSSVDYREASKFAILTARDWWDIHGAQKGLHAMNAIRIPLVKSALLKDKTPQTVDQCPLHGYSILDVGCGGGILSEVSSEHWLFGPGMPAIHDFLLF